jgi:large subunit ribosomal protein L25
MLELKVFKRNNQKVEKLRKEGKVPGVMYGPKLNSISIYADYKEFNKFLDEYEAGLFKVLLDDQILNGILQDVQKHPISGNVIHFDIYLPSLEEKIETKIPLVFINESPAISKGGVVNYNLEEIEILSLPTDIPEKIEVDLSVIENVGQSIYVRDLKVPEGVKILLDPDFPVVTVIEEQQTEQSLSSQVE